MTKQLSLFEEVIKPLAAIRLLWNQNKFKDVYHMSCPKIIPVSCQIHCSWIQRNEKKIQFAAIKQVKITVNAVFNSTSR